MKNIVEIYLCVAIVENKFKLVLCTVYISS